MAEIEALQTQLSEMKVSQDKFEAMKTSYKKKCHKLKFAIRSLESEKATYNEEKQAFQSEKDALLAEINQL
jgi:peptidoglycan hydrolase CwlO-like protein